MPQIADLEVVGSSPIGRTRVSQRKRPPNGGLLCGRLGVHLHALCTEHLRARAAAGHGALSGTLSGTLAVSCVPWARAASRSAPNCSAAARCRSAWGIW